MNNPKHLAIIPDWNRTRSKQQWISVFEWYLKSIDVAIELIQWIFTNTDIEVFSWRWMSTENLQKRSAEESEYLFWLFKICGDRIDDFLKEHRINFKWIGNPNWIADDFLAYLNQKTIDFTFEWSKKTLVFAVNYGWRDEIMRGFQAYSQAKESWLENREPTEDVLSSYMDLWNLPVIDYVIRTKWDVSCRTSGYMARWIWYAELFFTKTLYPAFTIDELKTALAHYEQIVQYRNFGA